MKLVVGKTKVGTNIAIIFVLLYCYATSFTLSKVYGSVTIAVATLVVALMFQLYAKSFRLMTKSILYVVLMAFVIFIRNQSITTGEWYSDVSLFVLLLFWAITIPWESMRITSKVFVYCGVVFAFFTFIFYFSSSLYSQYINLMFPQNSWYLMRNYEKGYMCGLTRNTAFNAGYILFGISVLAMRLINRDIKRKTSTIIIVIGMVIALFLTVKRNAILFGLAALGITYIVSSNRKDKVVKIIAWLIVGILLLALVSEFIPGVSSALDKTILQSEEGDISNGRFFKYAETIAVFVRNPVLGTGWGSMKTNAALLFSGVDSAHNIYLQLLAETGIVGFLIFAMFFIFNLRQAVIIIKDESYIEYKLESMIALFIEIYFLLYGLTGNPLYDAAFNIPYLLACAYIHGLRYRRNMNEQTERL